EFVAQLRPHVRRDSSLPRRIKELMARHRAIGSRDRKLYRELVYTWLRFLPWIDPLLDTDAPLAAKITAWLAPELKPTSIYRAAHAGDWPATPPSLAAKAAHLKSQISNPRFEPEALLPAWFREHCPAAFESPHLDAINSRANVWVRIQSNDRNLVIDEFKAQGWTLESPAGFPDALCLPPNAEVAVSDAYRRGFVEIQDLGSQLVLAHAPATLTGHWLDACAGAGGKTLQLARLLGEQGHVDATDIRPEILDELRDRAKRARLDNIRIVFPSVSAAGSGPRDDVTSQPQALYDGILVDAPCSGSGTWRRQPHLKWYVKPETIAAFAKTQREILAANAPRVKSGGLLIYATCSLSHHENQDVAAAFLNAHPEFTPEKPAQNHGGAFDGFGTTLLPGTLNTDGFYVAVLRKK
ncbi:MAG TPA: RsmB/NOP family class I SAM-dependent RNA methyltransferase, partial [Lacunisphaera sp.]